MNATLLKCNFQIKFEEQNLKSAWPCVFILISLSPVTGLSIVRVSKEMNISKYSLWVLAIKKKKLILCSSTFYFPTWMMREIAQDCTWPKRYAWPLKHEHVSTTTHILLCIIPRLKMVPEKRKCPETWGLAIITPSLVEAVNKPLQDTNTSCCEVACS